VKTKKRIGTTDERHEKWRASLDCPVDLTSEGKPEKEHPRSLKKKSRALFREIRSSQKKKIKGHNVISVLKPKCYVLCTTFGGFL
jgi:hypothetical protein